MTSGPPVTLGEAARHLEARFRDAGIDSWRADARLLAAHAAGVEPQVVVFRPEHPLSLAEVALVEGYATRRLAHEPVSRIFGQRGFWTLDLVVTPDTLDPRPDTETLVELVLAAEPDRAKALRIVDLGTGTGCILLALLSEYAAATGVGIDASAGAVDVATLNASRTGLTARADIRRGDWATDLPDQSADVVVSNPPYITEQEMADLAPDVRNYDPETALVAGVDGLDAYRALIPQARRILVPGGLLALEVGRGQAVTVGKMLSESGFEPVFTRADLAGVDRCVAGRRPAI